MNKIFKKIWNKRRGCFVAVSEAMTSASQRAGKAVVTVALGAMTVGSVQGAYVHNGDWYKGTLNGRNMHEHPLASDMTINGNFYFTHDNGVGDNFLIADTDGSGGFLTATLTINGNIYLWQHRDSSTNYNSTFNTAWAGNGNPTNGTLNLNGSMYLDYDSAFTGAIVNRNNGSAIATVNVRDSIVMANGSLVRLSGIYSGYGTARTSLTANRLELAGSWDCGNSSPGYNYTTVSINDAVINNGGYFLHRGANTDSTVTFANSLTLNSGGTLNNNGGLIVGASQNNRVNIGNYLKFAGGALADQSTLTQNLGTVEVSGGSYAFTTYNKTSGTLTNASTLTITNFNQSGGSASNTGNLTIGNSDLYGSLSNTGTLNLTGTVTSRGNLSSSGTLNNKGNWTETNTYAISGNLNNTGSVNFQNGFTLASNSRLTSSGTLQTNNAYNIFDSLGTTGQQDLHYVSLNSTVPQEVKTSLTDFFQKYLPGSVAKTLADHASFTGGKVIVTGVNLTQTQADDLTKAFKTKFFLS